MVSRRHHPRLARRSLLFSAGIVCLLIALLEVGCSSPPVGNSSATATKTLGSSGITPAAPTSTAQIVSTVITNLGPATTPLESPPQDCPIKSPPQQKPAGSLDHNTYPLVGGGVFWFISMFYSNVLDLNQPGADQRWPMTKWVVRVGPNYTQPVTLRLRDIRTNVLAWWTDAQTPPRAATQVLVLNPLTDTESVGSVPGVPDVPHGGSGSDWAEWGLFPVFFTAGCYALEVSWSGGSWQSIMAVGS